MPSAIQQESGLMSANVGDTHFYKGDLAMHFSWYKQPLGEKPQVISTIYKYDKALLHFTMSPRVTLAFQCKADMKSSDSATYYCGSAHSNVMEFGKGTILNIKDSGSNSKTFVEQSVSESVQSVQPGDSFRVTESPGWTDSDTGSCTTVVFLDPEPAKKVSVCIVQFRVTESPGRTDSDTGCWSTGRFLDPEPDKKANKPI
ncbi:unnamed protein product [Coregonus sp. 'balchen']|nr:unnamed protein product [Coregonus sp. 'balchen']